MATRNDFFILNTKLDKYFKLLCGNTGFSGAKDLSETQRRRFGFYLFILENVCDIDYDEDEIIDSIIDTDFNKVFFGENVNDFGMDVVYINEEKKQVKLFNFKYREKFNIDKSQSLNDNFISAKFLNLCLNFDSSKDNKYHKKLESKLIKLNDIFCNPKDEWEVKFYQVSNDAQEVKETNSELEHLSSVYEIEIEPLALPTISQFMSIRPKDINASIIVNKDALMCYSEDSKASAKSYIVRVRCDEIVRMTCNNNLLRSETNLEDLLPLADVGLEYSVLFDNVRGFVKNSKYNPNISTTIKNSPTKFFMYNNGITMVAKSISALNLAGNKSMKLEINDFQIVNGGQTLRSIHNFNQDNKDNISNYLCNSEVLIRIFMPDSGSNDIHKIAEYTNSQNSIKSSDLKSLSTEQIDIERYLDGHGIAYLRKSGDTGPDDQKEYKYMIKMETFGQILKSINGYPEKSTNSIKDIFDKDYDELFINGFDLKKSPELIKNYFEIIKEYKSLPHKGSQIKYFYTLYLLEKGVALKYPLLINKLEDCINSFEVENTSIIRKMGLLKFKEHLNKEFNI
ncbi:AIPR family protein [Buttiauxella sp. WJP83]|uniref:AIPR family protein n=1 Tax=Buttiauxella sp. WJP83 TaxID=2986951 RepID=UPI0022DE2629|nr:AIPR family protein [Buttiauxella sp. WJP83]WBM70132.1 AIPR family protein [Buttiauxella sp. WJP83]